MENKAGDCSPGFESTPLSEGCLACKVHILLHDATQIPMMQLTVKLCGFPPSVKDAVLLSSILQSHIDLQPCFQRQSNIFFNV